MPSWLEPAVELRRSKISQRLVQDLVRLAKFANLALKVTDPRLLSTRRPRPRALVPFRLPDPQPQRLLLAADLTGNRADRRPLRSVFFAMLAQKLQLAHERPQLC